MWRADDSNASAFAPLRLPSELSASEIDPPFMPAQSKGRRATRTPMTNAIVLFSKQAARPGAFTFHLQNCYEPRSALMMKTRSGLMMKNRSRQDLNLRLRPSQSRVLSAELREHLI